MATIWWLVTIVNGIPVIGVVSPAPTEPFGSKFLDGQVAADIIDNVFDSDGIYWNLEPNPTVNPIKQEIDLILLSESPVANPGLFEFRLEAAMLGGPSGDVIQSLKLWNEADSIWKVVDMRAATTTERVVAFSASGDLSRFVHPLTDEILSKVTWESPSFSGASFNWSIDLDQAAWIIE